jgi:hypothetical protein
MSWKQNKLAKFWHWIICYWQRHGVAIASHTSNCWFVQLHGYECVSHPCSLDKHGVWHCVYTKSRQGDTFWGMHLQINLPTLWWSEYAGRHCNTCSCYCTAGRWSSVIHTSLSDISIQSWAWDGSHVDCLHGSHCIGFGQDCDNPSCKCAIYVCHMVCVIVYDEWQLHCCSFVNRQGITATTQYKLTKAAETLTLHDVLLPLSNPHWRTWPGGVLAGLLPGWGCLILTSCCLPNSAETQQADTT